MNKDRIKDFFDDFLHHFVEGVNRKLKEKPTFELRVREQFVDSWVDEFWRELNED